MNRRITAYKIGWDVNRHTSRIWVRYEDGQSDQIVPSSGQEFTALALVLATGTARQNGGTIEAEQ